MNFDPSWHLDLLVPALAVWGEWPWVTEHGHPQFSVTFCCPTEPPGSCHLPPPSVSDQWNHYLCTKAQFVWTTSYGQQCSGSCVWHHGGQWQDGWWGRELLIFSLEMIIILPWKCSDLLAIPIMSSFPSLIFLTNRKVCLQFVLFLSASRRSPWSRVGSTGSHNALAELWCAGELVPSVRPVRSQFSLDGVDEVRLPVSLRFWSCHETDVWPFVTQVAARSTGAGNGLICPGPGADLWSGWCISDIS